jgi:hypothetical protein
MKKICLPALADVVEDKQECPFAALWTHGKNVLQALFQVSAAYLLFSSKLM